MRQRELIAKSRGLSIVNLPFLIRKVFDDEQIVTGEVYAPLLMDTHEEMMLPSDVRQMAHSFMLANRGQNIDVMHNNLRVEAAIVESFVARKGDPDYNEGAWVASTKILDKEVWAAKVKTGKLAGYSIEALIRKQKAVVEMEIYPRAYGYVEKADSHDHAFYIKINDRGQVSGGRTSTDEGHYHVIRFGTATEEPSDKATNFHQHRFFLV